MSSSSSTLWADCWNATFTSEDQRTGLGSRFLPLPERIAAPPTFRRPQPSCPTVSQHQLSDPQGLTVLSHRCGRGLQHLLGNVDERLEELPSPQEIEILDDLEGRQAGKGIYSEASGTLARLSPLWPLKQRCLYLQLADQIRLFHHQLP